MSLPKARACADCNQPLDYANGRWLNVAPEGSKERIVCRRCWRKNYRQPGRAATGAGGPSPAPVAAQPCNPIAVEIHKPASQALADAVIALVGASELRSRQHVKSELAKRWRGV
jgi:hypothetical protein